MSGKVEHAEDVEHELEHAGREVGESFADAVDETQDPEELGMLQEEAQ
jgi:hypothetical protein